MCGTSYISHVTHIVKRKFILGKTEHKLWPTEGKVQWMTCLTTPTLTFLTFL